MKVVNTTLDPNILELEISETIRDIDPNNNYFISFSGDSCLLDDNDVNLKSCSTYRSASKSTQIKGYYLKYGGPSLYSYIENNGIDVNTAWKWMIHLIKGLKLLHDNNVVHLDIKADNIVIDEDLKPKFIDFGLSKFASEFEQSDVCYYYRIYPLFYTVQCIKNIEKLYKEYEHLVEFYDKNYKRNTETDLILKLFNEATKYPSKYFKNTIKSNNFYLEPKVIPEFNEQAGIFKVDVYMLMKMINDYIYLPHFKNFTKDDRKVTNGIVATINKGLNVFPDKQYTSGDLLNYMDVK